MIKCTILDNGNLKITAGNESRAYINQHKDSRGYWSVMADLFETYSCNGSYTHFDASNGNPFIGLTDAPCIAEVMDSDDHGTNSISGRLWYFNNYVIENDLETLMKTGRVIYTLHQ